MSGVVLQKLTIWQSKYFLPFRKKTSNILILFSLKLLTFLFCFFLLKDEIILTRDVEAINAHQNAVYMIATSGGMEEKVQRNDRYS
jgi:hypothetical protein